MKFFRMVCLFLLTFYKRVMPEQGFNLKFINVPFQLIRRRYFADELPAASPWAIPVNNSSQSGEIMSDEDRLYKSTRYHFFLIVAGFAYASVPVTVHELDIICKQIKLLHQKLSPCHILNLVQEYM